MKTRDDALDKVRKLLAMATDGRGNENEAAAAARQAEAIMRKWQIDESEALLNEIEKDAQFSEGYGRCNPDDRGGHKFTSAPSWAGFLVVGVAIAFDCRGTFVNSSRDGVRARFQGFEPDVLAALALYDFLLREVWRLSKAYGGGRAAQYAFRQGCAARLQERLRALRAEREVQLALPNVPGTALVLYERKKERVEEMFGKDKEKTYSLAKREPDAFSAMVAGRRAGDSVQLHTSLARGSLEDQS